MTLRMPYLVPVLLLAAFVFTGCGPNRITFDSHSPYRSPVRVESPLVIVIPDDIDEQKERVNMKTFLFFRDRFDVYYGQSLRVEAAARFYNMFDDIVLLNETVYNELRISDGLAPIRLTERDPIEEAEADRRDRERERSPEAQAREQRRRELLDFVPQFAREASGYVLILERPRYVFHNGRSILMVQASLRDRFTDEVLMQGVMRGQGTRITPRRTAGMREYELHKSVVSANAILYNNMRNRIRSAIDDDIARNR